MTIPNSNTLDGLNALCALFVVRRKTLFNIVKTANLKRYKNCEKWLEKAKEEIAYYKRALKETKKDNQELTLQISELTRQLEYQASKKNTPVFHTGHTCEPLDEWTGPSSFNPPCKICGKVMK